MKHLTYLGTSVIAATVVSLLLSTYGSHGLLGFVAVYAGYPGGLVNWKLNQGSVSYVLITVVNAIVYLAVCEITAVLMRYRRSPKSFLAR